MNMRMYEANEDLRMIGLQRLTEDHNAAVKHIIEGMGLMLTTENIMLAANALQYGIIVGKRIERGKK